MENTFLQIIHPNQSAIIGGLIVAMLVVCGLIGFALIFDAIKNQREKNKKVKFRLMLVFGLILFLVPMLNWFRYYQIIRKEAKNHVGIFVSEDGNDVLELKEGGDWTAIGPKFECKKGTWELEMNEDFNYIEMESEESGHCSYQVFSTENRLTFSQSKLQLNRMK